LTKAHKKMIIFHFFVEKKKNKIKQIKKIS